MQAALASILDLPIEQVVDTTSDECRADWGGSIARWLADRRLKIVTRSSSADLAGKYSIGCGPSPRGPFAHAVVCKNGRMVFDPHPSDDGILDLHWHEVLEPMSETELKLHAAGGWYPPRSPA